MIRAAAVVLPARGTGQDRALAVPTADGYLVAIADGAGGTGDGAAAAERVIALVDEQSGEASPTDWFAVLLEVDDEMSSAGGQTTAVVAYVKGGRIVGASVGDSAAWLISPTGEMTDLTARQRRKPLLGSGEALPVQFEAELNGGRLLLASDGLIKYATVEQACALATQGSAREAAIALANCVRLTSGALRDDVAVVVLTAETN